MLWEKAAILRTTAWLHPNVVLQPALLAPFRAFSCRYEIFYQTDPHHRLSSNLSVRGKLGLLCSFTQERVVLSSPTRKRVQHQAIDSAAVTAQQQVVLLQPIPNACLYDMENVVPDTSEQAYNSFDTLGRPTVGASPFASITSHQNADCNTYDAVFVGERCVGP